MAMKSLKNAQRIRRKRRTRAKAMGKSVKPRLALFRSNKHLYLQLIDDENAKVLAAVSDFQVKKHGKDASHQMGQALAQKALKLGITKAVFDRSGYAYHGNVKAVHEGAREAGLQF